MKRVTLIVFLVFMVEAILHYNLGKRRVKSQKMNLDGIPPEVIQQFKDNNPQIYRDSIIPPTNDLIRLAIMVLVFSMISGYLIKR